MLHVRLTVPTDSCDDVLALLEHDPTVSNLAVVTGASRQPVGDLFLFNLARENATQLLHELRRLGIHHTGSIAFEEADVLMSDAADAAERAAPGSPADAVIWESIEAKAREGVQMSWSFVSFLVLATLIAGIGRYLDQPILIVGAMVVGPEFAPISSICFALARPRPRLIAPALTLLLGGFLIATVFACAWWSVADAFGWINAADASTGPATAFILQPNGWSLVIALLAGTAGVLSLTAAKSSTLVGVFISVTTVPAAGTVALSVAVGNWHGARESATQLGINLAGMVVAGTATFLVQRLIWRRVGFTPPVATRRGTRRGGTPSPG
jgi:uncharacterized hydrophobic protein (TIGR00271 family)